MKTVAENDKLTFFPEGKIHTNNAVQLEGEIFDTIKAYGGDNIVFDASKLTYISSAGLRMLLKVQQTKDKPIQIINVSDDVYEVFSVTGFAEFLNVRKRQ